MRCVRKPADGWIRLEVSMTRIPQVKEFWVIHSLLAFLSAWQSWWEHISTQVRHIIIKKGIKLAHRLTLNGRRTCHETQQGLLMETLSFTFDREEGGNTYCSAQRLSLSEKTESCRRREQHKNWAQISLSIKRLVVTAGQTLVETFPKLLLFFTAARSCLGTFVSRVLAIKGNLEGAHNLEAAISLIMRVHTEQGETVLPASN